MFASSSNNETKIRLLFLLFDDTHSVFEAAESGNIVARARVALLISSRRHRQQRSRFGGERGSRRGDMRLIEQRYWRTHGRTGAQADKRCC